MSLIWDQKAAPAVDSSSLKAPLKFWQKIMKKPVLTQVNISKKSWLCTNKEKTQFLMLSTYTRSHAPAWECIFTVAAVVIPIGDDRNERKHLSSFPHFVWERIPLPKPTNFNQPIYTFIISSTTVSPTLSFIDIASFYRIIVNIIDPL